MKPLASLLILTLWLGGCSGVKTPPTVHHLVEPAQFVTLGQQSSVVADALCVQVESLQPRSPSTEPTTPASLLVTFQITQRRVGDLQKEILKVRVDPSMAIQPGLHGGPFFVEGGTYRLFLSGEKTAVLQVGSLAQFDQYITEQLGRGRRVEVKVLP